MLNEITVDTKKSALERGDYEISSDGCRQIFLFFSKINQCFQVSNLLSKNYLFTELQCLFELEFQV